MTNFRTDGGSEPGFRTMLWPAKQGQIMVKHMDDTHLQNSIALMQKLHQGARRERNALVANSKRMKKHLHDWDVDRDETLEFVREKMKVMKKWIKTLKKERSYRKHRGITVPKGSIIMPTGMTRMVCENKLLKADGTPFNPDEDDPNRL